MRLVAARGDSRQGELWGSTVRACLEAGGIGFGLESAASGEDIGSRALFHVGCSQGRDSSQVGYLSTSSLH